MEVTLFQMLQAREERAERQRKLLGQFGKPLVCFTMNIPGPVKNGPLIRRAFRFGCGLLEKRVAGILHRESIDAVTGCEAMYAVDADPVELKRICTAIEDETPLGRLFDMDVLDPDGNKLDRSLVNGKSRDCIVCDAPGRGCASRRLHPVAELQKATHSILEAHFFPQDCGKIAETAVQSLIDEVHTTPKPGLVDRRNNGSHRDMTLDTFIASAKALGPYFGGCFAIGHETEELSPAETFAQLRRVGLEAEQAMYRATGGVNTHKGAIFTLGILCGSLGRLWNGEIPATEAILHECGRVAAVSLEEDFARLTGAGTTAGERLYLTRGITGIRGEAAAGLPAVTNVGLPVFRDCLAKGYSPNDAGAVTLLHLIARVADTNLYHRGGEEGAAWAAKEAEKLLPAPAMEQIEALDDAFIRRNLSPGGCADLLAVTYFLHALEEKCKL